MAVGVEKLGFRMAKRAHRQAADLGGFRHAALLVTFRLRTWSSRRLICPYFERFKAIFSKSCSKRCISGIPATCHQDATNAWFVVSRVENVPFAAQIRFEPRTKIHREWRWRNPNVAQVSGRVTCGNIHAAAERDCEVHEIPADADAFAKHIPRRSVHASLHIIELDMMVDEVTDRLHTRPTCGRRGKAIPGKFVELAVNFAIPASKEELEHLIRQFLNFMLPRVWLLRVRQTIAFDDCIVGKCDSPRWRESSSTAIAEPIDEFVNDKSWLNFELLTISKRAVT